MYQDVQTKLDEIVTEMKLIGLWQDEPLPPDKYNFRAPFALDTMAFNQWLQFIFVPRVTQILSSQVPFPCVARLGHKPFVNMIVFPKRHDLLSYYVPLMRYSK